MEDRFCACFYESLELFENLELKSADINYYLYY